MSNFTAGILKDLEERSERRGDVEAAHRYKIMRLEAEVRQYQIAFFITAVGFLIFALLVYYIPPMCG